MTTKKREEKDLMKAKPNILEEGIDFIRHFFSSPACLHRRPIDGIYDSDRYEVYI